MVHEAWQNDALDLCFEHRRNELKLCTRAFVVATSVRSTTSKHLQWTAYKPELGWFKDHLAQSAGWHFGTVHIWKQARQTCCVNKSVVFSLPQQMQCWKKFCGGSKVTMCTSHAAGDRFHSSFISGVLCAVQTSVLPWSCSQKKSNQNTGTIDPKKIAA